MPAGEFGGEGGVGVAAGDDLFFDIAEGDFHADAGLLEAGVFCGDLGFAVAPERERDGDAEAGDGFALIAGALGIDVRLDGDGGAAFVASETDGEALLAEFEQAHTKVEVVVFCRGEE